MPVRVDIGWLLATGLLSVRVAAATMLAPVFGPSQIPATTRVMLTLALSVLIVTALPPAAPAAVSVTELTQATLRELAIGGSLSFGFLAAYAATQFAGRVLDIQVGFSAAAILNPVSQSFAPLLGSVFGMAAIAVFLAMDGHQVLIEALALSVQQMPPGAAALTLDWTALLEQSGIMFSFGAALAAPILFTLLLTDLAMIVMARSMPQLNIFVLSFAVKIVLGLVGLAASIKLAEPLLAALYGRTFEYWEQVTSVH